MAGNRCTGVSYDAVTGAYHLKSSLNYIFEIGSSTWVKGQIWAPNFVPRIEWDARPPINVDNFKLPAEVGVIGHHTDTNSNRECFTYLECSQKVREIQDFHMDTNGWWDIGYNFLIGEDGRIYEGRGLNIEGAHCSGWNSKTLGFAIIDIGDKKIDSKYN